MLTVQLTCPRCSRHLRCHRLIAPGERLRCPHCGGQFRAGIDEAPQSVGGSNQAEPRRGHGILLGWLLFANLLLLAGGGFAIAVAFGNRARQDDGESEPRPLGSSWEDRSLTVAAPPPPVPTQADPPSKSAPPPDPVGNPSVDPPKPPPLPGPAQQETKRKTAAKGKPSEAEKHHAPAPNRRTESQVHWLPPSIQKQVDGSIDNGVEFLRRRQRADGSWGHQTGKAGKRFTPGIMALSGLTLLECGVPAKDPQVRSAALYLRQRMPDLTATYSISLAILFFDRLGDAADAARIRTLALRLIAGQKTSGGWDYYCPPLNDEEELGLLARLHKDRPTSSLDLFAVERNKELPLSRDARQSAKLNADLYRPRPSKIPPLELFVSRRSTENKSAEPSETKAPPAANKTETPPPHPAEPALPGDSRRLSKRALESAKKLPESLRQTPALRAADLLRSPPDLSDPRTDNSNTQFAILGLLTAENYDVPMERAMALIDWRFRNSLTAQGGWNYRPSWQTTPAMTAAALMGLALKHGLLLPNRRDRGRNVTVYDDLIQHGFVTLNGLLENYFAGFVFNQKPLDKLDLYCLWTVERVAVLYNLRTLGTLQWYPAGVQLLLPLQREDGSWSPKGTTCLEEPCVATSFALLFLKRSNLARDLSERLNVPAED